MTAGRSCWLQFGDAAHRRDLEAEACANLVPLMSANHRRILILWASWTLASAVAGTLAYACSTVVNQVLVPPFPKKPPPYTGTLEIATFGLAFALPQWIVLHRYVNRAILWLLLTTAGLFIALYVGLFVGVAAAASAMAGTRIGSPLILAFVVGGAVLGLPQWLLLLQAGRRAVSWIIASGIAGIALGPVALGADGASFRGRSDLLEITEHSAIYGAITGVALVWLLRDRLPFPSRAATPSTAA